MASPVSRKMPTVLVTAGTTIEDIDPVRFISNRATGKMGVEIARAAVRRGFRVVLVHGPIAENVRRRIPRSTQLLAVPVRSAAEMHRAVIKHVRGVEAVIMNAAVADYTPAKPARFKLKKASQMRTVRLKRTVDILKELGRLKFRRPGLVLIGFALESGQGRTAAARRTSQLAEARRKLIQKNLDAIVLDTPAAMGADTSDFTLLQRDGSARELRGISKERLARVLTDHIRQTLSFVP